MLDIRAGLRLGRTHPDVQALNLWPGNRNAGRGPAINAGRLQAEFRRLLDLTRLHNFIQVPLTRTQPTGPASCVHGPDRAPHWA